MTTDEDLRREIFLYVAAQADILEYEVETVLKDLQIVYDWIKSGKLPQPDVTLQ